MDKRGTGRWIIPLYILLAVVIFIGIPNVFYSSESYFRLNNYMVGDDPIGNECNDYDECTVDRVLIDGSCVHRPKKINSSCNNDICYGNATDKRCCDDGKCVSNRHNCAGICPNNGFQYNLPSNCTLAMFPVNYGVFDTYFLSCIYGSCTLTVIQNWAEKRTLDDSYLYNISSCNKNANYVKSKCISHFCTTNSGTIVCIFRYTCASFNFTTNAMDSVLNINDSNSSQSQEEEGNVTFPLFGDYLPLNEYRLLHSKFNKALKNTINNERI